MGAVMEGHALGLHLRDADVDDALLHLEVGDAVAQQAAGLGVLLVDVHVVAGARELLRAGHAGRSGADHRDLLAGLARRMRSGLIQPFAIARSAIAHSIVLMVTGLSSMLSVQDASHGAGQTRPVTSGKVVGRVQVARGLFPVAGVDEVVPVRDLVVDRAAGRRAGDGVGAVAIGHAAIHAARGLLAQFLLRQRQHELVPMPDALLDRLVVPVVPLELEEARDLAHPPSLGRLQRRLGHLGERAAELERHHLAELRKIAASNSARISAARREPVKRAWRVISMCSRWRRYCVMSVRSPCISPSIHSGISCSSTMARLQRCSNVPSSSST